jgi:hypothetical protein
MGAALFKSPEMGNKAMDINTQENKSMGKIVLFVLILFFTSLCVFLAGSGLAEEKQKTLRYTGVVREVNRKEKTLVAGKGNKSLGMLFHAENAIFRNIEGLQALKPGDAVVVEYDAKEGQTFAVSITKE